MIAVDTNILVYAHREDAPFHQAAFRRVAELAEAPAIWAIL
jgi:predicted nucleic acid-binding protein